MQLNHIAKSLLVMGLFTTSSLPLIAAEAPKEASAATQQGITHFIVNCRFPITAILLMLIKVLLLLYLRK